MCRYWFVSRITQISWQILTLTSYIALYMLTRTEKGKICYVPRVVSKTEMVFLRVYSMEDFESFPKSKYGIKEPPMEEKRY